MLSSQNFGYENLENNQRRLEIMIVNDTIVNNVLNRIKLTHRNLTSDILLFSRLPKPTTAMRRL